MRTGLSCQQETDPSLLVAAVQARLLCLSLGEAFCAADGAGQAAAAELLRDATRWAADDRLQVRGMRPTRAAALQQSPCMYMHCAMSFCRAALWFFDPTPVSPLPSVANRR